MWKQASRFCLTIVVLTGWLSNSHAEIVHEPIPDTSPIMHEFSPMVRFDKGMTIYDTTGNALEQPGQLCSPNPEIARNIVAYEECCKEDSNGDCTGNRDCRRVVATCVGTDGKAYESFGAPECEECIAIETEDAAEYESPFCSF